MSRDGFVGEALGLEIVFPPRLHASSRSHHLGTRRLLRLDFALSAFFLIHSNLPRYLRFHVQQTPQGLEYSRVGVARRPERRTNPLPGPRILLPHRPRHHGLQHRSVQGQRLLVLSPRLDTLELMEAHPAGAYGWLVPFHDRLPDYGATACTRTDQLQERICRVEGVDRAAPAAEDANHDGEDEDVKAGKRGWGVWVDSSQSSVYYYLYSPNRSSSVQSSL